MSKNTEGVSWLRQVAVFTGGETGVEIEVCYTTVQSKKDPQKPFGDF